MIEKDTGIVIATIRAAEPVAGTRRLHRITLEVADGVTIQVASGLPGDFPAGFLVGKQVPIQVDVEPTTIRGIPSQARFLATVGDDGRPVLIVPERPVPPGSKVW